MQFQATYSRLQWPKTSNVSWKRSTKIPKQKRNASKFPSNSANSLICIRPWNSWVARFFFQWKNKSKIWWNVLNLFLFQFFFRIVSDYSDLHQINFMAFFLRSLFTLCCALLIIEMELVEYIFINSNTNLYGTCNILHSYLWPFIFSSQIMKTIQWRFWYWDSMHATRFLSFSLLVSSANG